MTTEQYFNMLISASLEYDSSIADCAQKSSICSTNLHQLYDDPYNASLFTDTPPDVGEMVMDTPVDTVMAFAAMQGRQGYIPPKQYKQLSETSRELWGKLTPEDCAVIFCMKKGDGSNINPSKTPGRPIVNFRTPPNCKANLTEIAAYNFLVMQH